MHRLYINPKLRYFNIRKRKESANHKSEFSIHGVELSESKQAINVPADDLDWLTNATMPNDTQSAVLIGEPAYLIYREVNTKENKTVFEPLKNEEIIRLESTGGYCYVYLKDNTRYLLAMSLKWVSRYLGDFIRIHRTHAVNPIYVKQYLLDRQKTQKDRYLLLKNDEKIPWSRRHLRERRQDSPELFNLIV